MRGGTGGVGGSGCGRRLGEYLAQVRGHSPDHRFERWVEPRGGDDLQEDDCFAMTFCVQRQQFREHGEQVPAGCPPVPARVRYTRTARTGFDNGRARRTG